MLVDSAKLRATIEAITDLPTLPNVVARITSQINNPSTNAADIGKLIEQDPSLTSKVLRLVNSAYYGFPKQIKSIQHAVVILGFNKVKTMVVTASVFDLVKQRDYLGLDLKAFWKHSLTAAFASKVVAGVYSRDYSDDDAFIGGLLHDIGKIILDQYQPELYSPVIDHAQRDGILIVDAEKELLGPTHAVVGGWIMEKWRLPPIIVNMVQMHHKPSQAVNCREMVSAVHVGDIIARAIGIGSGGDFRIPAIDQSVQSIFLIDASGLNRILNRTIAELSKATEFFALISDSQI